MYSFFIRSTKDSGTAALYFKLKVNGIPKDVNTGLNVDIKTFRSKTTAKTLENYYKEIGVFSKLHDISDVVSDMVKAGESLEAIKERMGIIVNAEAIAAYEEHLEKQKQAEEEAAERERTDVLRYVTNFVESIKSGRRKRKGGEYAYNTIKCWAQFKERFSVFYNKHPFVWEDIDKSLVAEFSKYLADNGLSVSTREKTLNLFRTMCKFAYEDDINTNTKSLMAITTRTAGEEEKAKEIYLTANELDALYKMELTGLEAQVRDLFVFGCYTCQRYSDYSTIKKENFGVTERGVEVIRLKQKKTGHKVVIPIFNNVEKEIAASYGYNMPQIVDQVFNRYIKNIMKKLSETCESLAVKERTILRKPEREAEAAGKVSFERDAEGYVVRPRYEMVTSHTARRTGATLMFLSKNYTMQQMMRVTGHTTVRIFEEYIKLSGDEFAEDIIKRKKSDEEPF